MKGEKKLNVYSVGDFVEAKFDVGWFRGRVIEMSSSNKYKVLYDDDVVQNEPVHRLRPFIGHTKGEEVLHIHHGFSGTILHVKANGSVVLQGNSGRIYRDLDHKDLMRFE